MESYTLEIESFEIVVDSEYNANHYSTSLEAVRAAFGPIWQTCSTEGVRAAAKVQANCSSQAAFWVAFGLASTLLLEGRLGTCEEHAWVRASGLYQELMWPNFQTTPARVSRLTARPAIEGVNTPGTGETLAELNAWRQSVGLASVASRAKV